MKDVTFYAFLSNIKFFLSSLLKDPINTKLNDFLKEIGFTKQKLINILIKRDVIRRHEKVDDKDKENANINYIVKYNVVRKQFERKIKRIYNKYVEAVPKSEKQDVDEETVGCCTGGSIGYDAPLFGGQVMRRSISECEMKKNKKIYITEKQYEMLKEALTTTNSGDYGYDVPFPVKKNDPTMIHRKKGGISMDRLKK